MPQNFCATGNLSQYKTLCSCECEKKSTKFLAILVLCLPAIQLGIWKMYRNEIIVCSKLFNTFKFADFHKASSFKPVTDFSRLEADLRSFFFFRCTGKYLFSHPSFFIRSQVQTHTSRYIIKTLLRIWEMGYSSTRYTLTERIAAFKKRGSFVHSRLHLTMKRRTRRV